MTVSTFDLSMMMYQIHRSKRVDKVILAELLDDELSCDKTQNGEAQRDGR